MEGSENAEQENSDDLERVYVWIDQIPLSRAKRCMARDFSDGVLMAELLKRYYPRLVDLHNYVPANSVAKKLDNWSTLNYKVLSKLDMKLDKSVIRRLADAQGGLIEEILMGLRGKIARDCSAQGHSTFAEFEELDKRGKGKDRSAHGAQPKEAEANVMPPHVLLRLKQELAEKTELINKLREKVEHLEKLVELKDKRISDLLTRALKPRDGN